MIWETLGPIAVVAISTVGGLVGIQLNIAAKERTARRYAEAADKEERAKRQREKDDKDEYIRASLVKIERHNERLDSVLDRLCKEMQEVRGKVDGNDLIQVEVVRGVIEDIYEKCMAKGSIDKHTLEKLQELWNLYEKKGGNGYAGRLVKELNRLPIEK